MFSGLSLPARRWHSPPEQALSIFFRPFPPGPQVASLPGIPALLAAKSVVTLALALFGASFALAASEWWPVETLGAARAPSFLPPISPISPDWTSRPSPVAYLSVGNCFRPIHRPISRPVFGLEPSPAGPH